MDRAVPVPDVKLAWARLSVDFDCGLRRGAWYRVTRFTPTDVLLDVQRYPVAIPRRYLEVVLGRPLRWSVVPLPRDASKLPASLGAPYAVCPVCRTRAALKGRPAKLACAKCQGVFVVAWEEGYLKKGAGATAD